MHAIRSLYKSVECCVKLNEYFTNCFSVRRGVKQGCVLSPTLFSIYVNDLANDINDKLRGVDINGSNVAILLYADDIVLLSDSEANLQMMLNKLNDWCNKWRMTLIKRKQRSFTLDNKIKPDPIMILDAASIP